MELVALERDLERIQVALADLQAIPGEDDAQRKANATFELLRIVQALERRLDPQPPAAMIR